MSEPRGQSARAAALDVLDRFDRQRMDSRELLHDRIAGITSAGYRAAATDIVFGVLRNRSAIDSLISLFSGLPGARIRPKIRNVLRIGMYELVYTPATPEHAVVNEAVNLAHASAGKKGAGFVNAVLRNATRMISRRDAPFGEGAVRRCIPADVRTVCEFKQDVLPDPQQEPGAYFREAYSLPLWLVQDWLGRFGVDATRGICAASNRRPGIYIQPNTLRTSTEELAEIFAEADVECEVVADGDMLRLRKHAAVTSLPGFEAGLFTVQDATAARVADVLAPRAGERMLDLCAAPGGKTVRLAQLMQDRGHIVATDIDAGRLRMVRENCDRLGITIVECTELENVAGAKGSDGGYDGVLVDAPCSNTGVLARRCEVRMRVTAAAVRRLADVQMQLLEQAAMYVAAGGRICYSTCSIQTSENVEVVEAFIKRHPAFGVQHSALTLPFVAEDESFDHDGGFAAVLVKR